MNKTLFRALAVAALAVALPLGVPGPGDARAAEPADPLEALLKAAKLEYKKVKDGVYRALAETRGEVTPVVLELKKAPWKDKADKDVLYVWVWTEVIRFPAGFKPPTGMLSRLAELNDRCRFGNVGLSKGGDGGPTVYRNLSFFLKGADAEQLTDYVFLAHFERLALKKELKGFEE